VAFVPGGRAASISDDLTLRVWDLAAGRELRSLPGHTDEVWGVAVAPGGRCLLSSSRDQTLRVWDAASGKERRRWTTDAAVVGVALTPGGSRVPTGSGDVLRGGQWVRPTAYRVQRWDVASGRERWRFEGHTARVHAVAVAPDGRHALSASADRTVRLLRLPE
jgi:WD40 repeat protein